jgi:4-cresol dehydrogenase (hydroxylating) flavoprotein subunit
MSELSKMFESRVSRWLRPGGVVESLCGHRRDRGGVLLPECVSDVQEIVRAAAGARGAIRLQPVSCGKNWGFGSALPTKDGIYVLDLSCLRQIRRLDLRRHYVEVEPGVTQGGLDEALRVDGGSHYFNVTGAGLGASVIGNALERGIGYSGQRHLDVLDLEVVLPTGELVRTSRFSTHSPPAPYLGGLGPDPTGLFFQSNFGVVTAATIALQRRPEVMGGVICHLDSQARFPELVSIISNFLAEGACYGVPHIFNRERVITTLSPHLEEVRARELRSQAASWMALIPIKGCKAVFEASTQQVRDLLASLGRVEVLTNGADLGVSHLLEGRPTDLALASVAYGVFGRSAPLNAPVESSGAGLIHVTPIVPLCGKSILAVDHQTSKVLRRYGYERVPLSVNALSARTAAFIVSLGFDRRSPGRIRTAQSAAEELLKAYLRAGLIPYRLGLQQGDLLPAMDAPWRRILSEMQRTFDISGCMAPSRYESLWEDPPDGLLEGNTEECLCLR